MEPGRTPYSFFKEHREALFGLETKQAEAALLDQSRMHLDVNKQH